MKIAIFAARKTQLKYANKLSSHLKSNYNIELLVLWHKHLLTNLNSFLRITPPVSSDLNEIVDIFYQTKANEPSNINKKYSVNNFHFIKKLHSLLLYNLYSYSFRKSKITHLLIWNGLKFRQQIAVLAAKKLNIQCLFIERGAFPNTTTLDKNGINYINSVPRDRKFYENYINNTTPPRLNEGSDRPRSLPNNYIFIPFQVNTDSQIILFSPWLKNMFDLIDNVKSAVSLENNIPTIVFKTHPSCPQDYHHIAKEIGSFTDKIKFIDDIPTSVLIQHSCAVATINSSVGMEALLMRKKLIVMGQAFYNIDGICLQATTLESLIHSLNNIKDWQPDSKLTDSFLNYLKSDYIVDGHWKSSDEMHYICMSEKLIKMIDPS